MRHSIYIKLASILVIADVKSEQRQWQKRARRARYELPYQSKHLLSDVGLDQDGYAVQMPKAAEKAIEHRVELLRYVIKSRLVT
jgi:uncharacterized protein YjiS (DUF1127 family)